MGQCRLWLVDGEVPYSAHFRGGKFIGESLMYLPVPPQPDCASAWREAVRSVNDKPGHEAYNVIIDVPTRWQIPRKRILE